MARTTVLEYKAHLTQWVSVFHWYVSRFTARTTVLEYTAHLYTAGVMSALSSHPISMEGPHLPHCGAFAWLSGASNDCTPSV